MSTTLSLCMIVKNEEEVLERCLQSVANLVDEIIIMDTGSTDNTVTIARKFTDKVFPFKWINDFSAARNAGIKQASGEWILILDADEYIQEENKQSLKDYLANLDTTQVHAVALPVYNILGDGKVVESSGIRLFLNNSDIGYVNPIHEQVARSKGILHYEKYPFIVYHTGYIPEVIKTKNKSQRNMSILQNIQAQKTLRPYEKFTLANEHMVQKNFFEASQLYKEAFSVVPKTEEWAVHCASKLVQCFIELGMYNQGLVLLEECLKFWGKFPEFYSIRANLYLKLGLTHCAIRDYKQSIDIATASQNKKYWIISPDLGLTLPYLYLAEIYEKKLDINSAVYYLTKYLQINRYDIASLGKLVRIVAKYEDTRAALDLLSKLYSTQKSDDVLHLFYMSTLIAHTEFIEKYYRLCQEKSIEISTPFLMRFALISGNKALFDQKLNHAASTKTLNSNMNHLLYTASCYWRDESYFPFLTISDNMYSENLNDVLSKVYKKTEINLILSVEDLSIIKAILSDLFRMGLFEAYDWLINKFNGHLTELANAMAHAFFYDHEFQLAVDYCSLLINKNGLDGESYANLGHLYITQGDLEEGLSFLKKAIEFDYNKNDIYSILIENSPKEKDQLTYIALLNKTLAEPIDPKLFKLNRANA